MSAPHDPDLDGARFLVDRIWPRGIGRDTLAIVGWVRDAAPSSRLRKWFGHDPARWDEFVRRYHAELDANPDAWEPLSRQARLGPVTLLYAARDAEHNNAVALAGYLRLRQGPGGGRAIAGL